MSGTAHRRACRSWRSVAGGGRRALAAALAAFVALCALGGALAGAQAQAAAATAAAPSAAGWLLQRLGSSLPKSGISTLLALLRGQRQPSALPPDLSVSAFAPVEVGATPAWVAAALSAVQAGENALYAAVPGLQQQSAELEAGVAGPFTTVIALSYTPQVRIYALRTQIGLPASPGQLLAWLANPAEQLVGDNIGYEAGFFSQLYINFIFQGAGAGSRPVRLPNGRRLLSAAEADWEEGRVGTLRLPATPELRRAVQRALAARPRSAAAAPQRRRRLQPSVLSITLEELQSLMPLNQVQLVKSTDLIFRIGTQVTQDVDGTPLFVQNYARFGVDTAAAILDLLRLTPVPQSPAPPPPSPSPPPPSPPPANGIGRRRMHQANPLRPQPMPVAAPAPLEAIAQTPQAAEAPLPAEAPQAAAGPQAAPVRRTDVPPLELADTLAAAAASVPMPANFPLALLPEWQALLHQLSIQAGIPAALDPRLLAAAMNGPYVKNIALTIIPHIRIFTGQLQIGLPTTKSQAQSWAANFSEQLLTDADSFQFQLRLRFDLAIALRGVPAPFPPPPAVGRRHLRDGPLAAEEAALPGPHAWQAAAAADPRCAAERLPRLFNASAAAAAVDGGGRLAPGALLEHLTAFVSGMEHLSAADVPDACTPARFRRRKLAQTPPPATSPSWHELLLQWKKFEFGAVLVEIVGFFEDLNRINLNHLDTLPIVALPDYPSVIQLSVDFIAAAEELARFVLPPPPPPGVDDTASSG